jgi:hypothetical protein
MNQRIGNVGLLNLVNATEESIKGIERIENVGAVLIRKGNAHLLSKLNIGNIGSSMEIPEGFSYYNGILKIDDAYFQSISEPLKLMVNGILILDRDVKPTQQKMELLKLMVNGKVYSPPHLASFVNRVISKGEIETYHGAPPRFENGKLSLSNSFLQSFDEPINIVVNGYLSFSIDLNMDLFVEKISKLEVNGKIVLYENQESFLYKKTASLAACKVEVIPEGYEVLTSPLHLNARSIRRFRDKKLYTKKPIIIESDVSREQLSKAITKIQSTSVIVCQEEIEDLMYELVSLLDTEILSYEYAYVMVEGEEEWSNEQFLGLEKPSQFIVNGQLTLDENVDPAVLREKVLGLDLLGEVVLRNKNLKGVLQNMIRLNAGRIGEEKREKQGSSLQNVGELSL